MKHFGALWEVQGGKGDWYPMKPEDSQVIEDFHTAFRDGSHTEFVTKHFSFNAKAQTSYRIVFTAAEDHAYDWGLQRNEDTGRDRKLRRLTTHKPAGDCEGSGGSHGAAVHRSGRSSPEVDAASPLPRMSDEEHQRRRQEVEWWAEQQPQLRALKLGRENSLRSASESLHLSLEGWDIAARHLDEEEEDAQPWASLFHLGFYGDPYIGIPNVLVDTGTVGDARKVCGKLGRLIGAVAQLPPKLIRLDDRGVGIVAQAARLMREAEKRSSDFLVGLETGGISAVEAISTLRKELDGLAVGASLVTLGGWQTTQGKTRCRLKHVTFAFERESKDTFSITICNPGEGRGHHPKQDGEEKPRVLLSWRLVGIPRLRLCEETFLFLLFDVITASGASDQNGAWQLYDVLLPYLLQDNDGHLHRATCPQSSAPSCFSTVMRGDCSYFKASSACLRHLLIRGGLDAGKRKSVMYAARKLGLLVIYKRLVAILEGGERDFSRSHYLSISCACRQVAQKALRERREGRLTEQALQSARALIQAIERATFIACGDAEPAILELRSAPLAKMNLVTDEMRVLSFPNFTSLLSADDLNPDMGKVISTSVVVHIDILHLHEMAPITAAQGIVTSVLLLRDLLAKLLAEEQDEWRFANVAGVVEWAVTNLLPVPGQPESGGLLWSQLGLRRDAQLELMRALHFVALQYAAAVTDFQPLALSSGAYGKQLLTLAALFAQFDAVCRHGFSPDCGDFSNDTNEVAEGGDDPAVTAAATRIANAFASAPPLDVAQCGNPLLHFGRLTADTPLSGPAWLELRNRLMCSTSICPPQAKGICLFPPMKDKKWELTGLDTILDRPALLQLVDKLKSPERPAGISPWLEAQLQRVNDAWVEEAQKLTEQQGPKFAPVVPRHLRPDQLEPDLILWAWALEAEDIVALVPEWRQFLELAFIVQYFSILPEERKAKKQTRVGSPQVDVSLGFDVKCGGSPTLTSTVNFSSNYTVASIEITGASPQTLSWAALAKHEPAADVVQEDPEAIVVGLCCYSLSPFGKKRAELGRSDGSMTEEESETVLCALGAPYLRIPLLIGFLAQDRCHLLRFARMRVLTEAAVAEPGLWVSGFSPPPVEEAPAPDRAAIGRPLGLLAMEASSGVEKLAADLQRLMSKATDIANAQNVDFDYNGSSAQIFLCVLRLAIKVEVALRKWGPGQVVAQAAPVFDAFRTGIARRQLRAWFAAACRKLDVESCVKFQAHIALTIAVGEDVPSEDVILGAGALAYITSWAVTTAGSDGDAEFPMEPYGISCSDLMEVQQLIRVLIPKVLGTDVKLLSSTLSRILMIISGEDRNPRLGEPWRDTDEHGNKLPRGQYRGGTEESLVTIDLQRFRVVFHSRTMRSLPPEIAQAVEYQTFFGSRYPTCTLTRYEKCMVAHIKLDKEAYNLRYWHKAPSETLPGGCADYPSDTFSFDGVSWTSVGTGSSVLPDRFADLGADRGAIVTLRVVLDKSPPALAGGDNVSVEYWMPSSQDALRGDSDVRCLVRACEGGNVMWTDLCLPRITSESEGSSTSEVAHGVRVYQLKGHGNHCFRVLLWAADSRVAYRGDWISSLGVREEPLPTRIRDCAGWLAPGKDVHPPPDGCKNLPAVSISSCLEIVKVGPDSSTTSIPDLLLSGVLPDALTDGRRFQFWYSGKCLNAVPRKDGPGYGDGWFDYEYEVILNEHHGRLAKVIRKPTAAGYGAPLWRCRPLRLVDSSSVASDSPWYAIVDLFARVQPLSHVLIWVYDDFEPGAENPLKLAVVELTRLQLRFVPSGTPDSCRLCSVEFDGLYALTLCELLELDARAEGLPRLLRGLPAWLPLRRESGEVVILVPNATPLRPKIISEPFSTALVLDHRQLTELAVRYYSWSLHIGGSMLLPSTLQGTLYLCVMKFYARDYVAVSRLVESCAFDEPLTLNEARVFSRFFKAGTYEKDADGDSVETAGGVLDDRHPDACALRIRLALSAQDFQHSPDLHTSAYLQGFREYLDPGKDNELTLKGDIMAVKSSLAHLSREVRSPVILKMCGETVPRPAHGPGVGSSAGKTFAEVAKASVPFCADGEQLGMWSHVNTNLVKDPVQGPSILYMLRDLRHVGPRCVYAFNSGFLRCYALARGLSTATFNDRDCSLPVTELLARMWIGQLAGKKRESVEMRAAVTLLLMVRGRKHFPKMLSDSGASPSFPDLEDIACSEWVYLGAQGELTQSQIEGMSKEELHTATLKLKRRNNFSKAVHDAANFISQKKPLLKDGVTEFGGALNEATSREGEFCKMCLKPEGHLVVGTAMPLVNPLSGVDNRDLMIAPLLDLHNSFLETLKEAPSTSTSAFELDTVCKLPGGDTEVALGMVADYSKGITARLAALSTARKMLPKALLGPGGKPSSLAAVVADMQRLMDEAKVIWGNDVGQVMHQHAVLVRLANYVDCDECAEVTKNAFWLSRPAGLEQEAWLEYCLGAMMFAVEAEAGYSARHSLLCNINPTISSSISAGVLECALEMLFRASRASQLQTVVVAAQELKAACHEAITSVAAEAADCNFDDLSDASRKKIEQQSELLAGVLGSVRENTYMNSRKGGGATGKLFDYRLLLFEYLSGFMLRPKQYSVVQDIYVALSGKKPEPRVVQMIMGSGKTACVAPLLTLLLTCPSRPVLNVVPNPLVEQTRSIFRSLLGVTLGRRVFTFLFTRDDAKNQPGTKLTPPRTGLESLRRLQQKLDAARSSSSVIITTPASIKSLVLKYIELELQGGCGDSCEMAELLANVTRVLRQESAALIDEVDWVLHPLRSELNFPLGSNIPYPLQNRRIDIALVLLDAVMLDRVSGSPSIGACLFTKFREVESSLEVTALKSQIIETLEAGYRELAIQRMPHLVLHSQQFWHERLLRPVARWFLVWFSHEDGFAKDAARVGEETLLSFLADVDVWGASVTFVVEGPDGVGEEGRQVLNLARIWLHGYLPFLMSRGSRIHFGLLNDDDLVVAAASDAPMSRRLLGVPFVAKDVPAPAAEFAHPDILIGYTVLAYRIEGLRLHDVHVILGGLVKKVAAEPGPLSGRPTARLFAGWILTAQARLREGPEDGGELAMMKVPDLATVGHLGGPETVKQLWQLLRRLPELNYWYMHEKAFPQALRMQRQKLMASGQELGTEMVFGRRAGFSGTPSALLPRELGTCHFDLENVGEILLTLTDPRVVAGDVMVLPSGWTPKEFLKEIAQSTDPPFRVLIDTGAIITGLSNQEVAATLLESLPVDDIDGVVFLDSRDRQMVWLRNAVRAMPLQESGVPKERRFCFYDQVHTTGIDVKHKVDAVAIITLNATMTYRDLAQGAWRMRGIGRGQTVYIVLTPEIEHLIADRLRLPAEEPVNSHAVVRFLMSNHFLSEAKKHAALQHQNLGTMWRKRALSQLLGDGDQDKTIVEESKEQPASPTSPLVLAVGARVKTNKNVIGTVAWMGLIPRETGEWVGLVLDKPTGRNNGRFKGEGKQLFTCRPNHGLFVRPSTLTVVKGAVEAAPEGVSRTKVSAPKTSRGPILERFVDDVDYDLPANVAAPKMLDYDLRLLLDKHRTWLANTDLEAVQDCEDLIEKVRAACLRADASNGVEEEKEKEQEKELEIEKERVVQVVDETDKVKPWKIADVLACKLPEELYDLCDFMMGGLRLPVGCLHFPDGTRVSHNHTFNGFQVVSTGQRRMKSVRCILLCWDSSGRGQTVAVSLQEAEALRRYAHIASCGGRSLSGYYEVRLLDGTLLAAIPGSAPGEGSSCYHMEAQRLAQRFFNTDVDFNHGEVVTLAGALQEASSSPEERESFVQVLFGSRRRDGAAWERTILCKIVFGDAGELSQGAALLRQLCSVVAARNMSWDACWQALDRRRAMFVGLEDLAAFVASMSLSWSSKDVADLMNFIDVDSNGVFDLSEFQSALAKQPVLNEMLASSLEVDTGGCSLRVRDLVDALDRIYRAGRTNIDKAQQAAARSVGQDSYSNCRRVLQLDVLESFIQAKYQTLTEADISDLALDGGSGTWQVQIGDKWIDFDPVVLPLIKEACKKGESQFTYNARKQLYSVDLKEMVQVNTKTNISRRLRQGARKLLDESVGTGNPWSELGSTLHLSTASVVDLLKKIKDEDLSSEAARIVFNILTSDGVELASGKALREAQLLKCSFATDAAIEASKVQRASEELEGKWNQLLIGDSLAALSALQWASLLPGRMLLALRSLCALHLHASSAIAGNEAAIDLTGTIFAVERVLKRATKSAAANEVGLAVLGRFTDALRNQLQPEDRDVVRRLVAEVEKRFPVDREIRDRASELLERIDQDEELWEA